MDGYDDIPPPPPPLFKKQEVREVRMACTQEEEEETNPNVSHFRSGISHMPKEEEYKRRISAVIQERSGDLANLFDITVAVTTFQKTMPLLDFHYYKNGSQSHYNIVVSGFNEQVDVRCFYRSIFEGKQNVLSARVSPNTKNIVIEVDSVNSPKIRGFTIRGGDPDRMEGGISAMDLCNKKHGAELKELAILCAKNDMDAETLKKVGLMCYFLQEVKPRLVFDFKQNKSGSMYVVKVVGLSMNVDLAFLYQTFMCGDLKDKVSKVSMNPTSSILLLNVRPEFSGSRAIRSTRYQYPEDDFKVGSLIAIEKKSFKKNKKRRGTYKHARHRRVYN